MKLTVVYDRHIAHECHADSLSVPLVPVSLLEADMLMVAVALERTPSHQKLPFTFLLRHLESPPFFNRRFSMSISPHLVEQYFVLVSGQLLPQMMHLFGLLQGLAFVASTDICQASSLAHPARLRLLTCAIEHTTATISSLITLAFDFLALLHICICCVAHNNTPLSEQGCKERRSV